MTLSIRAIAATLAVTLLGHAASAAALTPPDAVKKLYNPEGGVFLVAHRGCHNPAPWQGLRTGAPENSRQALERCIALGVDMMEADIRRTKDGALVIIHDETVDRTTNGVGRVDQLTLAEIRTLRLRQNFGGAMAPQLTEENPMTLDELLALAKGRLMLNLDIKDPVDAQVATAVKKAGLGDQILIKALANDQSPALADLAVYRDTHFMPIVKAPDAGQVDDLDVIARRQAGAVHRVPAIEMVFLDTAQFETVRAVARDAHVRLWNNVLTSVGVLGVVDFGGDIDGLRDADATWSRQLEAGVTIFQTDEPGALLDYLERHPPAMAK